MSDRKYDRAYGRYFDQMVWTLIGPGQWRHASEAAWIDVTPGQPANHWMVKAAGRESAGKGARDLDGLLRSLGLRGAGGRTKLSPS
jgi:hypothetical protein